MKQKIIEEGLRLIDANETYPVQKLAFKFAYEIDEYKIDKAELVKLIGKNDSMIIEINKAIALRKFSDTLNIN